MKFKSCAYCGDPANQKEHVIPKWLYPKSKSKSKLQRLTVPACNKCNKSLANDEAHFCNMLLLAGKKSSVVSESRQLGSDLQKKIKSGRLYFYKQRPKRPLVQLMQKIIELATSNCQPITSRGWEKTQASGSLGEPIK